MNSIIKWSIATCIAMVLAAPASAQDQSALTNACADAARQYFGDYEARTEMRADDPRVDGTRTAGGTIYLETRSASVRCGFPARVLRLTEFYVDGQDKLSELQSGGNSSGGSSSQGSGLVQVRGVPTNDILNVRSGPGTNYRIVGALANGDTVRNLGCEDQGGSRWCEIEMMTDMRERGWVNARFLTVGSASQLPSMPSGEANGETRTERVRFASGSTGTEFTASLVPGASVRYLLGVSKGQQMYVRVDHINGPRTDFQIFHPDGSFLMPMRPTDQPYDGEAFLSGDHVVEVINRQGNTAEFNVILEID